MSMLVTGDGEEAVVEVADSYAGEFDADRIKQAQLKKVLLQYV